MYHRWLLILILDLSLSATTSLPSQATWGEEISDEEMDQIVAAVDDSTQAAWAEMRLRQAIADKPGTLMEVIQRQILLRALSTRHVPVDEFIACAETTLALMPNSRIMHVPICHFLAYSLADRNERLDKALEFALRAVHTIQRFMPDSTLKEDDALLWGTLGQIRLLRGEVRLAIAALRKALGTSPDSQRVLFFLGQAYEKNGQSNLALDAYIRSLAVFGRTYLAAEKPLRTLYQARYGSLTGLEERLVAAREASRQIMVFKTREVEQRAAEWTLRDVNRRTVRLSDFQGKITVLNFWSFWTGPRREELPSFQRLLQTFGKKDVAFIAINVSFDSEEEEHIAKVRALVERHHFTFPMVFADDSLANTEYHITRYPTVFVLDTLHFIRYHNVGFTETNEAIIKEQIRSLLEGTRSMQQKE